MKKMMLLLAEGFEEVEALTVVDLLRRASIGCDIIAVDGGCCVTGSHGIRVCADGALANADRSAYDGVILPGGMPGTKNLAASEQVLKLLRSYQAQGKWTAAICAAPTVLAKAGLLEGKRAVCYPGMEGQLTGAVIEDRDVVKDGTVITSRGVGTAIAFALELVGALDSREAAEALAKAIVCKPCCIKA